MMKTMMMTQKPASTNSSLPAANVRSPLPDDGPEVIMRNHVGVLLAVAGLLPGMILAAPLRLVIVVKLRCAVPWIGGHAPEAEVRCSSAETSVPVEGGTA